MDSSQPEHRALATCINRSGSLRDLHSRDAMQNKSKQREGGEREIEIERV